ncbi:hypothetical protein GCM10009839_68810 [Catenulispora yoronensis]|uniref:Uncharacterized protein n=1 Tax=Catenulispora yoronensis TaxID=450799 RepID=A0ABN2V5V3_9ACTN
MSTSTDTLASFLRTPGIIDFDGRPENTDGERERAMRYVAGAAHDTDDALDLLAALGLVEVPMARRPGRHRKAA